MHEKSNASDIKCNKILAVDLDDVLCTRPTCYEHLGVEKYNFCEPLIDNIEKVNELSEKGYTVIIYTARGMTQFSGNLNLIIDKLYNKTLNQLKSWNIKFDKLVMGKIAYDYLIDDKAINSNDNWFNYIVDDI